MAKILSDDYMILQRDLQNTSDLTTFHFRGKDLIDLISERIASRPATVSVGTSPPQDSIMGDLWFNSYDTFLQLYMFYQLTPTDDGYWIPCTPSFGGEYVPVDYSSLPLLEKY